jgi:hypothetical protein
LTGITTYEGRNENPLASGYLKTGKSKKIRSEIKALWDITPCTLLNSKPADTTLYPRRLDSSLAFL